MIEAIEEMNQINRLMTGFSPVIRDQPFSVCEKGDFSLSNPSWPRVGKCLVQEEVLLQHGKLTCKRADIMSMSTSDMPPLQPE